MLATPRQSNAATTSTGSAGWLHRLQETDAEFVE